MADYPLINGLKRDWSSVEIDLNGTIHVGVKEITWTESLEPAEVRGTRAQVLALTRGEHSAEGALIMYEEDARELLADLGTGYGEATFDITVNFSSPGTTTATTKLRGCRITSKEGGGSQGSDPLEMSFDLMILQIEEEGLTMVANPLL